MPERIPASELREVMDIKEAAEYLGVSHDTMYHYASSAFIPAFKLGNEALVKFDINLLPVFIQLHITGV